MRVSEVRRDTAETSITVKVNLDERQDSVITTPLNFLTHMLTLFTFHSGFSVEIHANSRDGDPHHLIEDIGIVLGMAVRNALGDKKGIERYGWVALPMDEAMVLAAIDISGRAHCNLDVSFKREKINDMPAEMIVHFFESFCQNLLCSLHIKQMYGSNDHHIAEACFKSFGRALSQACRMSDKFASITPSSKGVL